MEKNPALENFAAFIGEWKTSGTHPKLPGVTLLGYTSFSWMEGGAFVIIRSKSDDDKIPSGVSIIGSDNTKGEYFMLYFDDRPVSRKCEVTLQNNVWTWFRSAPEFSQRYTSTLSADGNTIIVKGEMSEDGTTWHQDLDLTCTRIK